MALRLMFNQEQLRQLRSTQRPKLDKAGEPVLARGGYATLEANKKETSWRFLDASPGAPTGFGVYVGKTKATYEVQRKVNGKVMRFAVGSTRDLSLKEAHLKAQRLIVESETKDVHPRVAKKAVLSEASLRHLTVNGAIQLYYDMLALRARPAKDGTLKMLRNAMARLSRSEVGLGEKELRDPTLEEQITRAFAATRLSAALKSNRLTDPIKLYMRSVGRVELTDEELRKLGVKSDAMRVRIRAAGVSAAEQTFASAFRAVRFVSEKEARQAHAAGRAPLVVGNPFQVLWEEGKMRDGKQLHEYYEKARVRNPLGQEDNTLGTAIEYLWSRRVAQRGQNESGVYYLLTTLFLGARRNETAELAWYDRIPEGERTTTSWVWLDDMAGRKKDGKPAVNPTTKKAGAQVFFADTKNRRDHNMPLGPFSLQLLRHRFERRLDEEDPRARWVYPARSAKALEGHYKDSKSLMRGLGKQLSVEFGPTPHDLRRTLGRYAGKLQIPDRIVSRLFNHLPPKNDDPDEGSKSSRRYQEPEWYELKEALERVEQLMASSAPSFYNELKPVAWPLLPVGKK